jgi:hypothetical protein
MAVGRASVKQDGSVPPVYDFYPGEYGVYRMTIDRRRV